MIMETGFFDDEFFAYAEDVDLGLRGRLAGWEAVAATDAVVYHKYSQTGGSLSPLKVYLVERNHYWVALKNFPLAVLLLLPLFTALRYLTQVHSVIAGSGTGGEFRDGRSKRKLVKALLKGWVDSLWGMPGMLNKRRQIMKLRRLNQQEFSELMHHYRITFRELLDNG
jgi:GT2 family glycosyltransferase